MDSLLCLLPKKIAFAAESNKNITQLILRKNAPSSAFSDGKQFFICEKGLCLSDENAVILTQNELDIFFERICRGSVYGFSEQIKNGFITVKGGHRIGFSGTAVVKNGEVVGMKNIGSYTIRIAHEIVGCSNEITKRINSGVIKNTLIVSPPGCGKTTVLRDIARFFSQNGRRVCVVDERSEIVAAESGAPSFESCKLCSFIDAVPKTEGIEKAVRSLSPELIIFDELGSENEAKRVLSAMNCGVSFVFSVHASNINEALSRMPVKNIVENGHVQLIASLDKNHCINEIRSLSK